MVITASLGSLHPLPLLYTSELSITSLVPDLSSSLLGADVSTSLAGATLELATRTRPIVLSFPKGRQTRKLLVAEHICHWQNSYFQAERFFRDGPACLLGYSTTIPVSSYRPICSETPVVLLIESYGGDIKSF